MSNQRPQAPDKETIADIKREIAYNTLTTLFSSDFSKNITQPSTTTGVSL